MRIKRKGSFAYDALLYAIALLLFCGMMLSNGNIGLKQGKITKASAECAMLAGYVSEYKMEIGSYPATLDVLTKGDGQYSYWIKTIPKDPWGNEYIYQYNDDGYVVFSLGDNGVNDGSSPDVIAMGDVGYVGK